MNSSHYSSIIRAYSSRYDYAQEALNLYTKILNKNIQPNDVIFQYTLYACSKLGNVKFAHDVLSQMKALNFQINSHHVHSIIKTYAVAVSTEFVPEHLIKLYLQDGWDLLNKCLILDHEKKNQMQNLENVEDDDLLVTSQVLNALLYLNVCLSLIHI